MTFENPDSAVTRRRFLTRLASGVFVSLGAPVFAEELLSTPPLTEGPFYPDRLPLDRDNDLIVIGKTTTKAIGEITHLTGRVLDINGNPVRGALVEIWQCDANAVYLHTADSGRKHQQQDRSFQGYGRFETGSNGAYRFRTIKPVPYPGRPAPHIHVKVSRGSREILTTQIFVRDHSGNGRDGVFNGLRDPLVRELVLCDFSPIKDSKLGELAARFDIIVGRTPAESAMIAGGAPGA